MHILNSSLLVIFLWMGSLVLAPSAKAEDTCGRTATVNYQKILIDTNSVQKGDGLRYYLEKDPIAKSYLDKYTSGSSTKWTSAIMGTTGTALILGGILTSGSNKKPLIIAGISMITVNFFIARTMEYTNETYLNQAVEEYNKRNLPKIMIDSPGRNQEASNQSPLQLNWTKEF